MSRMLFCPECNNMLIPKEDKENLTLVYACRLCDHVEPANNFRTYRHELEQRVAATQIVQDLASDPTLPRTKDARCPKCGHGEAVFFQATSRGEEEMVLFFVCCNPTCGERWREEDK